MEYPETEAVEAEGLIKTRGECSSREPLGWNGETLDNPTV